MNLTTKFTLEIIHISSGLNRLVIITKALQEVVVNIVPVPKVMTPDKQYRAVELMHECEARVAIVPMLHTVTMKIPLKVIFYAFVIIPIILMIEYENFIL